jgi:hypothetical protein
MIVLLGFDWVKGFLDGQRKTATIVTIAETDHRFRMACRLLEYSRGGQSERRLGHLYPLGHIEGAERETALPPDRVA